MTPDANSYTEMLRKFFSDLGLPKLDVDKLIDGRQRSLAGGYQPLGKHQDNLALQTEFVRKFSK